MPVTGCNYNYNYNIVPGLALCVYEVVREVSLKLTTLLSVSVTRYKLDLVSVNTYSSYKRHFGVLRVRKDDLTYGSTPKDDLNYLQYFYLMHPLHVTKFTSLFQSYLKVPLKKLKSDIGQLDSSFTTLHGTFGIINKNAEDLAKSVSRIKGDLPQVTKKLDKIIDIIKKTFVSTNDESKDKVKEATKINKGKIDSTVKSVDAKVASVICALKNYIDQRMKHYESKLKEQKEILTRLQLDQKVSTHIQAIKFPLKLFQNQTSLIIRTNLNILEDIQCNDISELEQRIEALKKYTNNGLSQLDVEQVRQDLSKFKEIVVPQDSGRIKPHLSILLNDYTKRREKAEADKKILELLEKYEKTTVTQDNVEQVRKAFEEFKFLGIGISSRDPSRIEKYLKFLVSGYQTKRDKIEAECALKKFSEISMTEQDVEQIMSRLEKIRNEIDKLKQEAINKFPDLTGLTHEKLTSFHDYIKKIKEYSQQLQTGYIKKLDEQKEKFDPIKKELDKLKPLEKLMEKAKVKKLTDIPILSNYRSITSGANGLLNFKSTIYSNIDKVEQSIDRLVTEIKGVNEEMLKIKSQLDSEKLELLDINQNATELEEHKNQLREAKSGLKQGKDSDKLQKFISTVSKLKDDDKIQAIPVIQQPQPKPTQGSIEGGTVQSTEDCPQSPGSRSAGTTGSVRPSPSVSRTGVSPTGQTPNVQKELQAVDNELHKLGLYVQKARTLGVITEKLDKDSIETPDQEYNLQAIDACISELKGLERQIKEEEKQSTGTGKPGVGGGNLGTSPAKGPLSTTLSKNEDLKSLLRDNKKAMDSYKDKLLKDTEELEGHEESSSAKSQEIEKLKEPMDSIQSSVTSVNKTKDTIQQLRKIKDNMYSVKSERKKINNHTKEVRELQGLDLPKHTQNVVSFLTQVSGTLTKIDEYLPKVKERVNGSVKPDVTIDINDEKKDIDSEIQSITQTKERLTTSDAEIQTHYEDYLDNFDTFKQSICKVEFEIESVVRDFIGFSLQSLGDSLGKQLVHGYDHNKVRQMLGALKEVICQLRESINQLVQSHFSPVTCHTVCIYISIFIL